MKLKKLLKNLPVNLVKGSKDIEITGICSDSRIVAPGNLFVAKRGTHDDGTRYIPEAIAGGAAAIASDLYNPAIKGITQVIDTDVRELEANLAAEFYGHPSERLLTIGITGTNGKTTTAYLIRHLLENLEIPTGLIGTVQTIVGGHSFASSLTTPGVTTCQKLLRDMVLNDCRAAVLEVTSHALDQGRCAGIHFDIGIFTNLSLDHLDYHKTMEAYAKAKAKLFEEVPCAIVNADDPYHTAMLEGHAGEVITYGERGELSAEGIDYSLEGTTFSIRGVPFSLPLVGPYNVSNALAAIAVGRTRGASLEQIAAILATCPQVPGRLERVGRNVFVDFAHTPDALRELLLALKVLGRVVLVFGCGGDRDASKRPEMGAIAQELADVVIVTSDNPRSEDPEKICQEIAPHPAPYVEVIVDRRAAIARAIEVAKPDDLVLIAGKGHETTQIFAHSRVPFDDREVAREALDA